MLSFVSLFSLYQSVVAVSLEIFIVMQCLFFRQQDSVMKCLLRPGIETASRRSFFLQNDASENRIDTHKKNHINPIADMMKKSAIIVGLRIFFPSFLSSCHEKATEALCIEQS